ncbi:hypothetical protein [Promicromonospora sukumoe]|uniref:hypothetical protein n=1 Tax=Promicromonospora sukumoe TaxID=88382 RepID=UPI00035FCB19|nr:hypothetical protein [Promicromonospora sukumoe]
MNNSSGNYFTAGSGNAINIGGSRNTANVTNLGNGPAHSELIAAVQAIRELAPHVPDADRAVLDEVAEEIVQVPPHDSARLGRKLTLARSFIEGLSGTTALAAGAAKAVGDAIKALGL